GRLRALHRRHHHHAQEAECVLRHLLRGQACVHGALELISGGEHFCDLGGERVVVDFEALHHSPSSPSTRRACALTSLSPIPGSACAGTRPVARCASFRAPSTAASSRCGVSSPMSSEKTMSVSSPRPSTTASTYRSLSLPRNRSRSF